MGNRGTYPKQQAVAIRFKAVQVLHDVYQTSVARNLAGRSKNSGTTRPERVFLKKLPLLREEGQIADFWNFMFTDGTLPLPRNLKVSGKVLCSRSHGKKNGCGKPYPERTGLQIGYYMTTIPVSPGRQPGKRKTRRAA